MERRSFLNALMMTVAGALTRAASGQSVECPIHGNSGAYFTGKTKTVDGVLLYEYRCPGGGGHTFWAAQPKVEKDRSGVQCPIHGNSGAYFTGRTKTVDGVLLYEYHCPSGGGHSFWQKP
jgi:nitrite reductase/ring-hydroxylating ferredoxin subunit